MSGVDLKIRPLPYGQVKVDGKQLLMPKHDLTI